MVFFNLLIFIFLGVLLLIILVPLFFIRLLSGRGRGFRGATPDNGYVYRPRGKKEGEVSVQGEDPSSEEKIVSDDIGEYVDFEEVDERKK